MIILLFAFGTVVAMGLPITTAILGLASGLAIVGILGHLIEVPSVAETLATMIGLGVGIDYSLFIISRHRAQMREGMDVEESIARSRADVGRRRRVRGQHRHHRALIARPSPGSRSSPRSGSRRRWSS